MNGSAGTDRRDVLTLARDADARLSVPRRYLWSAFAVLEALFLLISVLSYNKQHIHTLVCLYLLSFVPFAWGLYLASMRTPSIRTIFITGLIFRLTLLGSFPIFSDDVFRYLWEGKMQLEGMNPYLAAPADLAAAPFRDTYFEQVNHKSIPTIYPPLSELFFRGCAGVFYNLYFFKSMMIVLDMGVLFLLNSLRNARSMGRASLLMWAWHPLVIVEIAGSGHQDIIGIFFLSGCLYFLQQKQKIPSALMLIGSFLSKLFPLMLFPLLLRKQRRWPYLLLLVLTVLFYLPFLGSDTRLFTGLSVYTRTWEANASIFYMLKELFGSPHTAKLVIASMFLAVYVYSYRSISDFEVACFIVLGSFLIFSPTLHPWYILWMIPFLVLRFDRAWLYLSMASIAYYHVLFDYFGKDLWLEQIWIKFLIYSPFFVFLIISSLKKKTCVNHC